MSWTSFIAWRYFRSPKKNQFVNLATYISLITSTLAIAFLVLSFSIFRGYTNVLTQKLTQHSGHFAITDSEAFETEDIKPLIAHLKHEYIAESSGLLASGSNSTPVHLYASSSFNLKNIDSSHIPIIVSQTLANQMHYKPTDIITVIVPTPVPAPFFLLPENLTCEIVKIAKLESEELNENGILMNLNDLQNVLDLGQKIHRIKCFSKNFKKVDRDFERINKALPKKFVLHWKEMNEFFLKMMKSEQNVFSLLLFMLALLSALLYLLAIGMFINSKTRDIQILKILGCASPNISTIFLKYSLIVAIINVGLGTILGFIFSLNINKLVSLIEKIFKISIFTEEAYLINYIPTQIAFVDIFCISALSLSLSFLFSFLVARKVGSIDIFKNL